MKWLMKTLNARYEAVQQQNLAQQQALMGLTSETDWRTVTSATANWRDLFIARCESPPEAMLLNALIDNYGLTPHKGILQSHLMKLQLQVEFDRRRVDFLMNDKIVLEVDGRTYHSSAQSIQKDVERDRYFRDRGMGVVRIPASDIFRDVNAALRAIATNSDVTMKPVIAAAKPRLSIGQMFDKAVDALGDFNADIQNRDEKAPDTELGRAFEAKKEALFDDVKVVKRAMLVATRRVEAEKYRTQSAEHARWFDEASPKLKNQYGEREPAYNLPRLPNWTSDVMGQRRAFARIDEARKTYCDGVRQQLRGDSALAEQVKRKLSDDGQQTLWETIAP